jgi:transcriptional regulator with XRE-family HTH domain
MREARTAKEVKLKDLADSLDVSLPYLSDIERGHRDPPSDERVRKIASYLQADPIPLLAAAARDRGKVILSTEDKSDDHVQIAVLLASKWNDLTHEIVGKLLRVLKRV